MWQNCKSGQWSQFNSYVIDYADQTCHCHHVSLQPLQRSNIWSSSNTNWLNKPTSHMWQRRKSGQWSQNISILMSQLPHHVCLNIWYGTNANRLKMPTHMWKNCKSGQWSQINSYIIDWTDQTCHFHHVSLQPIQRNNIWSYPNTYWLNKPTSHMWQSWRSGLWKYLILILASQLRTQITHIMKAWTYVMVQIQPGYKA